MKETINQLKKEIEEEKKIFETLDVFAQNRIRKVFERVTKHERLFIINILEAKLKTLQEVCEEINDYFISSECVLQLDLAMEIKQELLKKFQGEEI